MLDNLYITYYYYIQFSKCFWIFTTESFTYLRLHNRKLLQTDRNQFLIFCFSFWWTKYPYPLSSITSQQLQIGNILTYFLLLSCSNNNNRKPSASITISFFTNNFYFWKIDVSNIINKSIRFETNKCTLETCL